MKKLTLLALAVVAALGIATVAYAQQRCGPNLCIGTVNTPLEVGGNLIVKGPGTDTTCTLNAGSPSTCTATVVAGSTCTCSNVGSSAAIAAAGCAVSLSGTTLTVTSANAGANVVNIHCI